MVTGRSIEVRDVGVALRFTPAGGWFWDMDVEYADDEPARWRRIPLQGDERRTAMDVLHTVLMTLLGLDSWPDGDALEQLAALQAPLAAMLERAGYVRQKADAWLRDGVSLSTLAAVQDLVDRPEGGGLRP